MAAPPSRQLLHLLTSRRGAVAFDVAVAQQRSGAGRPVLVLAGDAADLTPPDNIECVTVGEVTAAGQRRIVDYPALLELLFQSDSISVW
jgi:hypothetical protein